LGGPGGHANLLTSSVSCHQGSSNTPIHP